MDAVELCLNDIDLRTHVEQDALGLPGVLGPAHLTKQHSLGVGDVAVEVREYDVWADVACADARLPHLLHHIAALLELAAVLRRHLVQAEHLCFWQHTLQQVLGELRIPQLATGHDPLLVHSIGPWVLCYALKYVELEVVPDD